MLIVLLGRTFGSKGAFSIRNVTVVVGAVLFVWFFFFKKYILHS